MKRTKLECTKCKSLISKSNFDRHIAVCTGLTKPKLPIPEKFDCRFCDKTNFKSLRSLRSHETLCPHNPDGKRSWLAENRASLNFHTSEKYREKQRKNQLGRRPSQETKEKIRKSVIARYKNPNERLRHSEIMKKVVAQNPESYSTKNVCGRVRQIEYNGQILSGSWELLAAKFFDSHQIRWTRNVTPVSYFWNGKDHFYFPDFYLSEYDLFVEVKGYCRDRDIAKWSAVDNIKILKEAEINRIKNGSYSIEELLLTA